MLIYELSPPQPRPAKGEAPLKRGRGRDPAYHKYDKVAGRIRILRIKNKALL